jgi:hypothetical protein
MIMGRKPGTGLTDQQAKHLAAELRPFLDRFDGNQTRMAKAWDISQSQLSQLLGGRHKGAGVMVLCKLRAATGKSIDDLLGLPALGATLDDRIRDAVTKALDELELEPSEKKRPSRPHAPPDNAARLHLTTTPRGR